MQKDNEQQGQQTPRPACPVCGGEMIDSRPVFPLSHDLRDVLRRGPRMIFRLSQKLSTKIKTGPLNAMPLGDNPYADWSCHLFSADRTQYVIVTNTKSLYSCVTYGKGITNDSVFIERALSSLREFMECDGQAFVYQKFIAPASGSVSFAKALNRSVTGSMNDMIYHAKRWLIEKELSPFDVGFKLNEMPMSALGYGNPREEFKVLAVAGDVIEGDE